MSESTGQEVGTQTEDTAIVADQAASETAGAQVDIAKPEATEATDHAKEDKPKPRPWFEKVIAENAFTAREATRRAEQAESELARYRQSQAPAQQTETQPPAGYVPASEVDKRAAERIAEERFVNSCNATAEAGQAKYPDFQTAVSNFGLLGGVKPEFLQAITALGTDDGAKVFYELGSNPDDAARVMSLPPVQMAMEVARRASAPVKQAPVSKVPAPIEPITTNSVRAGPPDAAKSPEAYRKWFAEEYRKSRA